MQKNNNQNIKLMRMLLLITSAYKCIVTEETVTYEKRINRKLRQRSDFFITRIKRENIEFVTSLIIEKNDEAEQHVCFPQGNIRGDK